MKSKGTRVFLLMTLFCGLVSVSFFFPHSTAAEQELKTVAESSNFTATSRYADVLAFVNTLKELSSSLRLETLCISSEGREIPLLVLGAPPPNPAGRCLVDLLSAMSAGTDKLLDDVFFADAQMFHFFTKGLLFFCTYAERHDISLIFYSIQYYQSDGGKMQNTLVYLLRNF